MQESREVIKHSAAVQIQNKMTLLQRKAWNELLFNAYHELPTEELHYMAIKTLINRLEYNSNDESYIEEILEKLVICEVKWNLLGKDDQWEWGVTTMLAQAKIKNGILTYAYSPELRQRLHNPRMFVRLNLTMQNKFESKHAEALWEHCVDYFDVSRSEGETPFIPLPTYREMMGIDDEMYPQFRRLNELVIKKPVAEINRVTNFNVKIDYKRTGRKVHAVKFKVNMENKLPVKIKEQATMFPDLDDMPQIIYELKNSGLSSNDAWKIYQKQWDYVDKAKRPTNPGDDPEAAFTIYIKEKIHLLKTQKTSGKKLISPNGFLIKAIKQNYANPAFAEEQSLNAAERKLQAQQRENEKYKTQGEDLSNLERERADACHKICESIFKQNEKLFEAASTYVLEHKKREIHFFYQAALSPEGNYRSSFYFRSEVNDWLETQQPEHFKTIRTTHDPKIKAIKAELAALDE